MHILEIWEYRNKFADAFISQQLEDIGPTGIDDSPAFHYLFYTQERDVRKAFFDLEPELAGRIAAKMFPAQIEPDDDVALVHACVRMRFKLDEMLDKKFAPDTSKDIEPREE